MYSPIVLLIVFVIRFPIFAWTFGSLRLGSAEIDRFKTFIDRPWDFRDAAIVSSASVSSVFIVGTSPVYGRWEEGLRWETFRVSIGRPRDGERGTLLAELARAGEGEALGERAVERVVIVVEGGLEVWAPGTARFCCPLEIKRKVDESRVQRIEYKTYFCSQTSTTNNVF